VSPTHNRPLRTLSTALALLGVAGIAQAAPVAAAGSATAADPAAPATAPSGTSGPVGATGPVSQARLTAALRNIDGPRVVAGSSIPFDAARSQDDSGKIVSYRWEWDGQGSPSTTTSVARATHVFTSPGTTLVRLQVTDDQGRQAATQLKLRVLPATATRAAPASTPKARAAAGASVSIKDFSFGPSAITVHVGDTVTWSNQGPSSHTATGSGFDTGILKKGQSASHTFNSAGTFSYICSIHPFMKASVTVVAATSGSGAGASTGTTGANPAAAAAPTGPTLPNTGTNTVGQAAIGLGIVALGIGLRVLTRRRKTSG
jgi:LPXTG-motif cell wall-anchored protein